MMQTGQMHGRVSAPRHPTTTFAKQDRFAAGNFAAVRRRTAQVNPHPARGSAVRGSAAPSAASSRKVRHRRPQKRAQSCTPTPEQHMGRFRAHQRLVAAPPHHPIQRHQVPCREMPGQDGSAPPPPRGTAERRAISAVIAAIRALGARW